MLSGREKELISFLPQKTAETVLSTPSFERFNLPALLSTEHWSKPIHYSWFIEILNGFPSVMQNYFLSLLSPKASRRCASCISFKALSS